MRRREWHFAHTLFCTALNPKTSDTHYKAVHKLVARKILNDDDVDKWFSFESFLELMGLATLNQEDSGGLYALHAHVNHSCEPNLMVSDSIYLG